MDLITRAAALCVAGALIILIIKQGSPATAPLTAAGIIITIALFLMPSIGELLGLNDGR